MDCVLLDRYALPATVCYLSLLDEWQSKVRLSLCAQEGGERPLCFAYNRVYWNVRYQREQYEPPEGVEDRRRQELTGLIRRGYRSWYRRIPRYQARIRQMGRRLNDTNDATGLIALLNQAVQNFCVYFGVDHFQFLGIAQLLYRQLQQICHDRELRRQAEQLVGALSAKNKTVQANQELLKIAQKLRSTPGERSLIERYPPSEVYRRIGLREAPVLARRLARFCKKHGHRSVSCDDLAFPHWGEDPQRLVALLAQLVSGDAQPSGGGKGLKRQCARLARRMSGSGVSYRQAKECLKLTGEYMRLRENQRYYFDQSWVLLRQILLRLGQLFTVQGRLQRPDEIFHLTIAEVRLAAEYPAQPILQTLVEERARLFEQGQHAAPPYMLKDSSEVEVQKGAGASSYKGLGISPGKARGRVCLVRDVDDLGRLRQGDIGVVRTFHPSWTPMLRMVSGLIMSYGNLLSHGAVVAREYGVPVAVFNGDAMQALHDEDEVEFNGSTGRIRVLHPAGEAQSR